MRSAYARKLHVRRKSIRALKALNAAAGGDEQSQVEIDFCHCAENLRLKEEEFAESRSKNHSAAFYAAVSRRGSRDSGYDRCLAANFVQLHLISKQIAVRIKNAGFFLPSVDNQARPAKLPPVVFIPAVFGGPPCPCDWA